MSFETAHQFRSWTAQSTEMSVAVVLDLRAGADVIADVVQRTRRVTHEALSVAQQWLGDTRFEGSLLVVLTQGAVTVADEDITDVASAAVWGLIRSAQSEDPGRIILVDSDSPGDATGLVPQTLAVGEAQVAIRGETAYVARLSRVNPATESLPTRLGESLSSGSVVITGGTGGLGAVVARHLVSAHGARSLVLASRRGESAPGAPELMAELSELGARVSIVACDVSTRAGVTALLAAVPPYAPLAGVVHTAGVLDDGVVSALTPQRVDTVLAAKAEAAWWLHEATKDLDLALFVLYSSAAGVLGGAGVANYAAANTFLDALAQFRQRRGLPAVSIAWGLWDSGSGMGARLRGEDTTRFGRGGVTGMTVEQGLSWFDASISQH
ncbi:beta-ketoacyl reductase, partial [Nocardia sp. NPDC058497]|uniref:beta-ketoacyl reductase n=1 Tax=Nocardia sp. NPDC058497 TaxID=3346529 RepID=UPI00364BB563